MADLPRLAVTPSWAEWVVLAQGEPVVIAMPERPTMPCPVCLGHGRRWRNGQPDGVQCSCFTGIVPIPEGTRVEVGWWEEVPKVLANGIAYDWSWRPVATATLAEVTRAYKTTIKGRDADVEHHFGRRGGHR